MARVEEVLDGDLTDEAIEVEQEALSLVGSKWGSGNGCAEGPIERLEAKPTEETAGSAVVSSVETMVKATWWVGLPWEDIGQEGVFTGGG